MFTMAQIPGIVLPIFAGVLVDKFEARLCLVVLSVACFIGHILASYGIELERYDFVLQKIFQRNQADLVYALFVSPSQVGQ